MSAGTTLASSWLSGTVRHRRRQPVGHEFRYHTGMLALNLDDWHRLGEVSPLVSVERFNWLALYRQDYLEPRVPDLRQAVTEKVETATGWRPDGAIELITHPRHLGYVFNPVSFYFCYRAGDVPGEAAVPAVILAQITNTPWHQRHLYCLEFDEPVVTSAGWHTLRAEFGKRFHVSPFNPMDQAYQWTFSFRGPELRIHMNVHQAGDLDAPAPVKIFDATLVVRRTPINRRTIRKSLLRFPVESFKVVAGIYWHALRLRLKGVPFHTHPDKLPDSHPDRELGKDDWGQALQPGDYSRSPPSGAKATRISSWRT